MKNTQVIKIFLESINMLDVNCGAYGIVFDFPTGDKLEMSQFVNVPSPVLLAIKACFEALDTLPDQLNAIAVEVHTSSYFIVKSMNEWITKWQENNWLALTGNIKYRGLWEQLIQKASLFNIRWIWTNTSEQYTMQCERLAKQAISDKKGLSLQAVI